MKQIYNFEQAGPPVLNENMIRTEIKKRQIRRQTALLAAAGMLLMAAVIMLGLLLYDHFPWAALGCFAYALISATGGSVMAVVFTRKGGFLA